MKHLVSADWLNDHKNDKNVVILYTTLIAKKAIVPDQLIDKQIQGARLFDLQQVFSDQNSDLPNTYPSVEQFERGCKALGINNNSKIVVYDTVGIYSSPRVWFLFQSMGHQEVYVLDGGLKNWVNKGYPTIQKEGYKVPEGNFKANPDSAFVVSMKQVQENLMTQLAQVIDARSKARFIGETPEPRKGLKSGHIQHANNLHYADLLEDGRYKSEEEIRKLFHFKVEDDKPIIFSCGSGITACILYLAADALLQNEIKVYDGSWTEWGRT